MKHAMSLRELFINYFNIWFETESIIERYFDTPALEVNKRREFGFNGLGCESRQVIPKLL